MRSAATAAARRRRQKAAEAAGKAGARLGLELPPVAHDLDGHALPTVRGVRGEQHLARGAAVDGLPSVEAWDDK